MFCGLVVIKTMGTKIAMLIVLKTTLFLPQGCLLEVWHTLEDVLHSLVEDKLTKINSTVDIVMITFVLRTW
jgi:hypothetical protein